MTRISKQGTTSVNIISAVKGHWTYDEGCKGLQRVAIGNIAIFAGSLYSQTFQGNIEIHVTKYKLLLNRGGH